MDTIHRTQNRFSNVYSIGRLIFPLIIIAGFLILPHYRAICMQLVQSSMDDLQDKKTRKKFGWVVCPRIDCRLREKLQPEGGFFVY